MRFDVLFTAHANLSACVSVDVSSEDQAMSIAEGMEKEWVIDTVKNPEIAGVLYDGKPKRNNKR